MKWMRQHSCCKMKAELTYQRGCVPPCGLAALVMEFQWDTRSAALQQWLLSHFLCP